MSDSLRFQRILEKIEEVLALAERQDGLIDTRELTDFMRDLYGVEAARKARELETRAGGRSFARLVRVTIEALEREDQRRNKA